MLVLVLILSGKNCSLCDLEKFYIISRPELDFSTKTEPLRQLIHKDSDWCWFDVHDKAFNGLKQDLVSPPVLAYYDVQKLVRIRCDSSQGGTGAVCIQGNKPITYASKAFTKTQTKYAQIEKELLAVVFACNKFHDYICGKRITVETDHQPLVSILNKPLHKAPLHLQRMMIVLQRYDINIVYKKGKELYVADTLSRAYQPDDLMDIGEDQYEVMAISPVSSTRQIELRDCAANDPGYMKLYTTVKDGWLRSMENVHKDIRCYFPLRDELSISENLVLRGDRIVVPSMLRQEYIARIHLGHPGAEACKRRASETIYWPSIDDDITEFVKNCQHCNALKPYQQKEELNSYKTPTLPLGNGCH